MEYGGNKYANIIIDVPSTRSTRLGGRQGLKCAGDRRSTLPAKDGRAGGPTRGWTHLTRGSTGRERSNWVKNVSPCVGDAILKIHQVEWRHFGSNTQER